MQGRWAHEALDWERPSMRHDGNNYHRHQATYYPHQDTTDPPPPLRVPVKKHWERFDVCMRDANVTANTTGGAVCFSEADSDARRNVPVFALRKSKVKRAATCDGTQTQVRWGRY